MSSHSPHRLDFPKEWHTISLIGSLAYTKKNSPNKTIGIGVILFMAYPRDYYVVDD